jgi:tRNA(fMet)-specific endonuclease VapC
MIRFLLDTNIPSLFLRNGNSAVVTRMQQADPAELAVSTITEAEMRFGAALLPKEARLRATVDRFLSEIVVLPWDSLCAQSYAAMAARQQQIGKTLSVTDAMIAAHALAYQLTLVSNDGVFRFVEDLVVEDWTGEQLLP